MRRKPVRPKGATFLRSTPDVSVEMVATAVSVDMMLGVGRVDTERRVTASEHQSCRGHNSHDREHPHFLDRLHCHSSGNGRQYRRLPWRRSPRGSARYTSRNTVDRSHSRSEDVDEDSFTLSPDGRGLACTALPYVPDRETVDCFGLPWRSKNRAAGGSLPALHHSRASDSPWWCSAGLERRSPDRWLDAAGRGMLCVRLTETGEGDVAVTGPCGRPARAPGGTTRGTCHRESLTAPLP